MRPAAGQRVFEAAWLGSGRCRLALAVWLMDEGWAEGLSDPGSRSRRETLAIACDRA